MKLLLEGSSFLSLSICRKLDLCFLYMVSKLEAPFKASDLNTITLPQVGSSSQNALNSSIVDESTNNPYFLPVAENPRIILSSQPLIGPENYTAWTKSVFLALSARNKFVFVNGAISKPEVTSPLYNSWCRCNTMVLSWLVNSLI